MAMVVFAAYSRIVILNGRTGLRKVDPYWTYNHSYHDVSALMLIDMNNDGHVDIVPDNEPPVFTSTPPKSLWQHFGPTPPGGLVTHFYDLTAGDTITFSLKSAPAWVTLSGPARVRFEPTCGSYGYPCPWGWTTVIVTATDSRGASTDQIFIVNLTTASVTVPNVVGLLFEAAKAALIAQDLQGVQWVETFGSQPAGTVLAQDAVAGTVVGRFDDIRLTVSKGRMPVRVPVVVGRTESAATAALTGAGFTVGVTRQFSATVARGVVISQVPAGNNEVPPGAAQIVVSSGNGLALTLSSGLMPANGTLTARPAAFDVIGNPLPAPALTYLITPRQTPYAGTLPTIAGATISAGAATLGSFTLTATTPAMREPPVRTSRL